MLINSLIFTKCIFCFSNNYGFVTFECRDDAYDAKERGNKDPSLPKYELSFGGRRTFCKDRYTDLGKNRSYYYIYTKMLLLYLEVGNNS